MSNLFRRNTLRLFFTAIFLVSSAAAAGEKVVLNQDNLEERLIKDSNRLAEVYLSVQDAQNMASAERGRLLPQISAGVFLSLIPTAGFSANSVACLVPFLFPSNWGRFLAARKRYSAELISLYAVRLNTLELALRTLNMIATDRAAYAIMEATFEESKKFFDDTVGLLRQAGEIGGEEYADAREALDTAALDLNKMKEVLINDDRALMQIVTLPANGDFEVTYSDPVVGELEKPYNPDTILEDVAKIKGRAPEREQLSHLKEAAEHSSFATKWGFLGGCTGNQGSVGTGANADSTAFSFGAGASVQFGLSYFPEVDISERAVEHISVRENELHNELAGILRQAQQRVTLYQERLEKAQSRVESARRVLESKDANAAVSTKSQLVIAKEILGAKIAYSRARIGVLDAQTFIYNNRITLKRLAVEERFIKMLIDSRWQLEIAANQ